MFDPVSLGVMAGGQIIGSVFKGSADQANAAQQRKDAAQERMAGFFGDFISRDDVRAGRYAVDRQNTFNAFVNPLFNTPIDYGYQLAAKKDDLYNFKPQEYALERQRNFLADERELNPIVRQNKANDLKLAGKYRAFQDALPALNQFGPFNYATA